MSYNFRIGLVQCDRQLGQTPNDDYRDEFVPIRPKINAIAGREPKIQRLQNANRVLIRRLLAKQGEHRGQWRFSCCFRQERDRKQRIQHCFEQSEQ